MISNDDYREFLSVAATCTCNFILSGDDRQISSIGRGRQFKVFANHYYSSNIYNANRQSPEWGKSVAMAGMGLLSLGQRREILGQTTLLLLWTFYLKWRSSIQGKKQANACC